MPVSETEPVTLPHEENLAATPLYRRPAVLRLLIIALLAEIGYAVLNISTMPVYLKNERQFGETVVGLVVIAFLFSEAIFKSPMGQWADRKGHKNFMMLGPAISMVTALLSLAIPHHWGHLEVIAFLILRAFDGLAAAMLWPAAFAAISDTVEDHEQHQAMSLMNFCYMTGLAFSMLLGGAINDLAGAKWASLIFASSLFAAVVICVYLFVPKGFRYRAGEMQDAPGFKLGDLLLALKRVPGLLLLTVITFTGVGMPMAIIKFFATDEFGMSESKFGALVFPAAVTLALTSVPLAKFGEKIGRNRAVHYGMALCVAGLGLIALGGFFSPFRNGLILALGGIPVGVGFLLAIPAWMASISDFDKGQRGTFLGAIMTAQGIGAILGVFLGSAAYEKLAVWGLNVHLSHYSPFIGSTLFVAAGLVMSFRLLPRST